MAENKQQNPNTETEADVKELIKIRMDKLNELQGAGENPFDEVVYQRDTMTQAIKDAFESYEGKSVSIAGRLMSKRVMGKASFCDVADLQGRIQLYVRKDEVGEDDYKKFKKFDIGDIVGVTGEVFRTHMGEISIKATGIKLLSKSLLPLPEKWHGLKDPDLRFRQRYVDLIVNPEVRDTFVKRSMIIREIRNYLDERGFLEVDTPILNTIPGGAAARPFITHHNTLDIDMYLRIATELYLKRLIVGGMEKVYEMGRIFRNEGMDIKHNPEFTTIEIYEAYTDYNGMMDLAEGLFKYVAEKVCGSLQISYQGTDIDLSKWERITMLDAVQKYAGVDFRQCPDAQSARQAAEAAGVHIDEKKASRGEIIYAVFEEKVEDQLIQPTFVLDYPVEVSPLAKRKVDDPEFTQRFEFFIYAREMGNAFSELNDPIDQYERFKKQVELREAGDDEANMMDEDFVNALKYGMPPTGGIGIGIDRLVMLLTDSYSIRDVLLFPTMKPIEKN